MSINRLNILVVIIAFIFIVNLASSSTLEPVKLNNCIDLTQSCANCTYVNITSILYPNGTKIVNNVEMTKIGTEYNYTFCDTKQYGIYTYNTMGNPDGYIDTEPVTFEVNPSGSELSIGGSITMFGALVMMLVISILLFFLGMTNENKVGKLVFYTFSVIFFLMVILYIVIIVQQTLFGFDSIITATESFWFVVKSLMTVGIIAFFVIIFLMMLKYWKIKRGLID